MTLNYDTTNNEDKNKEQYWDLDDDRGTSEIICMFGFCVAIVAAIITPAPYLTGIWMIAYQLAKIANRIK